MKLIRYARTPLLLTCLAVLASCGGGGDDEAGANTAFSVSPTEFTFGWGAGGCGSTQVNDIVEVFVIGGTAPYQVKVSNPTLVSVNTTVVPKGGSFKVTYLASATCFDPSTITVEDDLDRVATVTLVSEVAD